MNEKCVSLIPLSQTEEINSGCASSLQDWLDNRVGLHTYPAGLDCRIEPVQIKNAVLAKFFPYSSGRRVWEYKLADRVNFSLDWTVCDFEVTDFGFYLPADSRESHIQLVAEVTLEADRLRPGKFV